VGGGTIINVFQFILISTQLCLLFLHNIITAIKTGAKLPGIYLALVMRNWKKSTEGRLRLNGSD
jgi:hypothetical protein